LGYRLEEREGAIYTQRERCYTHHEANDYANTYQRYGVAHALKGPEGLEGSEGLIEAHGRLPNHQRDLIETHTRPGSSLLIRYIT
jgi:hypothetical protein